MRLLPNQLRIAVTERTPVAFVRHGSQIGLVDANGVLLDMPSDAAGDPHYSFPVLTGLSGGDPLSTRAARMAIYERFLQELGAKNSATISEADVSNPEDVKAVVSSGGSDILVHFGDEDFLHRYEEFEQHLPDWKQQYPKLAAADMRYERQVVLEMQPGTGVPMKSDSGAAADGTGAAVATPAGSAAGTSTAGIPTAAAPSTVLKTPAKAAPKPVPRAAVPAKGKSASSAGAVSAGKGTTGNGKIFADLAAARRAKEARAKQAAGAGER
jgi:cell division protein FtsQ